MDFYVVIDFILQNEIVGLTSLFASLELKDFLWISFYRR